MITGAVNHIGINTVDLETSVRFYEDVMGFSFLGEENLGSDYAAYMKVDENTTLELFRTDGTLPVCEPGDGHIGLKHIAFDVDSVDAWYEKLQGLGVTITLDPCNVLAIGKRVLLFQAPDYVIIELCCDM